VGVESKAGSRQGLAAALKGVAGAIREIEFRAEEALHSRDDQEAYRELMREKAVVLQQLPEAMAHFLAGMDRRERDAIRERLERFSAGASSALRLNSPFYMSALLYPEDYKQGDPNDLENYVSELESKGGRP
jgi:hypothetical protein